jgi:chemotaxis protein MotA
LEINNSRKYFTLLNKKCLLNIFKAKLLYQKSNTQPSLLKMEIKLFFPGLAVVFLCVFGGYIIMGGNMMIIIKAAPMELVIILGSAIGAFMIGNPKRITAQATGAFKTILKGSPYGKEDYLELLSLLYMIFKTAKTKGMLALESHVENPQESPLFQQFPKILADHHAVEFICDYLRMMTMGTDNPHQMEDLINEELEVHHHENEQLSGSYTNMGDGLPALGIVAAVLGVIKTMAAIDQPPAILGKMIGGALVGTFLGVFLAYGIVGPMGNILKSIHEEEGKYYQCIKVGLISYMNGYAPVIALEFARKTLLSHVRPSFYDIEKRVADLPSI